MFLRRRKGGGVYRARLNPQFRIGVHQDPLLEIYHGEHWVGLLPRTLASCFEILAATRRETNQLALLTEYPLRYSAKFTLRREPIPRWIDVRVDALVKQQMLPMNGTAAFQGPL
jgi:hypothetical protein